MNTAITMYSVWNGTDGIYAAPEPFATRTEARAFIANPPILLADEKAKPLLTGLRTERLAQALRLSGVRREILGDDVLTRGSLVYPDRLQVDEATFSLG